MLTADSTSLASAKMEGVAENFVSHAFLQGGQWGGGVCVCVCGEGTTESRFPCNQIQKLPGEPRSKSPQGASVGSDTVGLILPSRRIPGV